MSAAPITTKSCAFYALITVTLVFMSVGPIFFMLINSFKLDVDIISGTGEPVFPADDPATTKPPSAISSALRSRPILTIAR